jgi:hypothetical protein
MNMKTYSKKELEIAVKKSQLIDAIAKIEDQDILAVTLLAMGKRFSSKRMLKSNLEFCCLVERKETK